MPTTTINSREVQIDAEGFMTDPSEWDEAIAEVLAANIGIELTEAHWKILRFLRQDFATQGETATTRRVQTVGGFPTKDQFALFPKKPAKKMAYIAGLPKPRGCV
jgi:tRNA 2-thiouridine synthesizing protein E